MRNKLKKLRDSIILDNVEFLENYDLVGKSIIGQFEFAVSHIHVGYGLIMSDHSIYVYYPNVNDDKLERKHSGAYHCKSLSRKKFTQLILDDALLESDLKLLDDLNIINLKIMKSYKKLKKEDKSLYKQYMKLKKEFEAN